VTLRKWYDAYAVNYTMTQAVLIRTLGQTLQIKGRKPLTAIINRATLDVPGPAGSFAARVRAAADAAVAAQVTALQALLAGIGVTDEQIGYRGSVARGTKSAAKSDGTAGYPIDWDDVDVDLFIVSDQLAQNLGGTGQFANKNATIRTQMLQIEATLLNAINTTPNLLPPGKATKPSEFRVYTQADFARRTQPSFFTEGGQKVPQPNPARIIDANGQVTVVGG
jgi:hypothetical protein